MRTTNLMKFDGKSRWSSRAEAIIPMLAPDFAKSAGKPTLSLRHPQNVQKKPTCQLERLCRSSYTLSAVRGAVLVCRNRGAGRAVVDGFRRRTRSFLDRRPSGLKVEDEEKGRRPTSWPLSK